MLDSVRSVMSAFGIGGGSSPSFEAAGRGRRLRNFNPRKQHINAAIQNAGPTLIARARWLYENDGYVGNAVDEWASHAAGDGIKPRPSISSRTRRRALLKLFKRWAKHADADGMTDYFGLQEKVAREAYLAGECFVRVRKRRRSDMPGLPPFQLQMLPSEMLDSGYDDTLSNGNYIRAGIEFNAIGKRVGYWFWRWHPYDERPGGKSYGLEERRFVPAEEVLHVFDGRQGGQIRGVPRVARVLVKVFGLEVYDDSELERKKTTSLFAAFFTGRGEPPLDLDEDGDGDEEELNLAPMEPGAMIDLPSDRDVKFSQPTEVGNSYEPFQYRQLLKISAGLGVPYAYVTGDVTKGNFSNVRTEIIRFRRRINQWQFNTLIFQLCDPVWKTFVDFAEMAGLVTLPGYDRDPHEYWDVDHLPPAMEWVDPIKDVKANIAAIDAGLTSRTKVIAGQGYDREDLDDEIEEERKDAEKRGLQFGSGGGGDPAASDGADGADAAPSGDQGGNNNA